MILSVYIALLDIALLDIVLLDIALLSPVLALASLVTSLWAGQMVLIIFRCEISGSKNIEHAVCVGLTTGTSVQVYSIIFAGSCFPVPRLLDGACALNVVRANNNSVFERAVYPLFSQRQPVK